MSIGRALDLPSGPLYVDLRQALDAIDLVHGVGALPRIPVRLVNGLGVRGQFRFNTATRQPEIIVVKLDQEHRGFSTLHEIGHFLDFAALGAGGQFSSIVSPVFDSWTRAVASTNPFIYLQTMRRTATGEMIGGDGTAEPTVLSSPQLESVRKLLRPEEVWARCYSQYIAIRSGQPRMIRSLDHFRAPRLGAVYYPLQWTAEDFEAVAAAIDVIFQLEGWME